ncbi:MAG: DNA-directed RNA polymerase subunit omega [Acidobacteria bacterium RIFCSPLOWO2_12_FULL_67_14]|nr:MAG: DNA-directed RNA polymerase subunit omega [Acidobacteria bacterium RIFCSPLOWO2_02_FULL_67_21]OFW37267.1 MAG: DNA-directed RNA polymerase subunit omega [Acidobacteria bacterium RIFCSPLOWO2_12_FULL_67_14]
MDTDALIGQEAEEAAPPAPRPKAPPIESRFLFVDVAAMRAKQLRRGAPVRLDENDRTRVHRPIPHKAERIAMEEVRHGLVLYEVPSGAEKQA